MNVFEYCASQPCCHIDPFGLDSQDASTPGHANSPSRDITASGLISVSDKETYKWREDILGRYSWNRLAVEQEVDFTVFLTTEFSLTIEIVGPKGPPLVKGGPAPQAVGELVTVHWAKHNFVPPSAEVIGGAIRNARAAAPAITGKLCRKRVYLKQNCCVKKTVGWLSRIAVKETSNYFVKVDLFGEVVVPSNSIPAVAQCDVSKAEEVVNRTVDELNKKKYRMCEHGMPPFVEERAYVSGGVQTELPKYGWFSGIGTTTYKAGGHVALKLHAWNAYKKG